MHQAPRHGAGIQTVHDLIWACHEQLLGASQALEEKGEGRVLVVDGGGSHRCALLGDNIAEMGYKNGWSVSHLSLP